LGDHLEPYACYGDIKELDGEMVENSFSAKEVRDLHGNVDQGKSDEALGAFSGGPPRDIADPMRESACLNGNKKCEDCIPDDKINEIKEMLKNNKNNK